MELTLTGRYHEITRQTSIRTIYEGLVELITNSIDAYNIIGAQRKDVWVEIIRMGHSTQVSVIDQATGMTKEEMVTNLLTVGSYTAANTSRGFFGRGCKDCSFLGDITFTCVKDGKINQITIKQDRSVENAIDDLDVTPELRSTYQILQNGSHVSILCSSDMVEPTRAFYNSLRYNVFLRKIYETSTVILKEPATFFNELVKYHYPERKLVVSCDYDIPEYNTTAHLEIYRSMAPLPFPKSADQRQFAINVQSSRSVFENCALFYEGGGAKVQDYIFNPSIQLMSGVLVCDAIERIAKDAIDGNNKIEISPGVYKIDPKNPFLVVDPNRRGGLIKTHPFTAALYSKAYQMLSIIIERIQDTREEILLDNGDAADVMKSLADFVNHMLPDHSPLYVFRSHDDQEKLDSIVEIMKNVNLDSDFLGLTWDQIQELSRNKILQINQTVTAKSGFDISFTKDPTVTTPYTILYLPGRVSMKINANDPTIKPFISITDEKVTLINSGKAMTAVGSMVIDAATDLVVRKNIMSGNTSNLDISGFNEYQYSYNSSRSNLVGGITGRVLVGIASMKQT